MKKICTKCKIEKDAADFWSGRTWCKSCDKEKNARWYENNHQKALDKAYRWKEKNPDKARRAVKNWVAKNSDRVKKLGRDWYVKNRELCLRRASQSQKKRYSTTIRNEQLKTKYGISLEKYNKMFRDQSGNCAICGKNRSQERRDLGVDHDHVTGKVRGLLCSKCNSALGMFCDNIEIVRKALKYLEKYL
jgi:thiol-disulfide isomerase/thioredoxin